MNRGLARRLIFRGDDDDDERCASYMWTVYDGKGRMAESKMKIHSSSSDAVKISRVRAYHFKPGSEDFLNNKKCLFKEETGQHFWLGGDSDDDGTYWPGNNTWLTLGDGNCDQLGTIQANGQWPFDKFSTDKCQ